MVLLEDLKEEENVPKSLCIFSNHTLIEEEGEREFNKDPFSKMFVIGVKQVLT